MSNRIKLVVAYDGTDFCGWAAQRGLRSVQSTLKDAVRQVSGEDCEITGASRTDSGAHARGQVCHFDTEAGIPPERWAYAINRATPDDISVVRSVQVRPDFHSRFSARDRWYRYRILNAPKDPFRLRFAAYHPMPLNLEAMQKASEFFVGKHDFRAFSEELEPDQSSVRELKRVAVRRAGPEIWIDIVGLAFIRGMMRRISGGLLEVGSGRRPISDLHELLTNHGNSELIWPVVLPARGLTLMEVRYGRHPRDNRNKDSA